MGRYYYIRASNDNGNISYEDKFWFGVQNSNDFENLGFVKAENQEMVWEGCGCTFYSLDKEEEYCTECYGSYEEHKEAAEKDGEVVECLCYESCKVNYEANKEEVYDKICDMIKDFEKRGFRDCFEKFKLIAIEEEDSEDINVDCMWKIKENTNKNREFVARYALCKIVKYIFDLGAENISVDCEF